MAFCLMSIVLVASAQTESAEATTTWPLQLTGTRTGTLFAHSEDSFTMLPCGDAGGYNIKNGSVFNSMPSTNAAGDYYECDAENGDAYKDGWFFPVLRHDYATSTLVGFKNGREVWSTDITYSADCSPSGYGSHVANATSMSIGSDGNLIMVIKPMESYSNNCEDKLVKINRTTGEILFSTSLGNPQGYVTRSMMRVWTYSNKIVVMDSRKKLREFNYAGIENVPASYLFPASNQQDIYDVVADSEGTVFAMALNDDNNPQVVMFHKVNGEVGTIDAPTDIWNPILMPSDGGNFAIANSSRSGQAYINRYDTSSNSYSTTNLTSLPGYSRQQIMSYIEDEGNKALVSRALTSANFLQHAAALDMIDYSTNPATVTNLLYLEQATNPGAKAPALGMSRTMPHSGILDGDLYLPVCFDVSYCGYQAPESWIYKIQLTGFGSVVTNRLDRSAWSSQKLDYVAMGDSYSSGEGNGQFAYPTDRESGASYGENRCHRSGYAYPYLFDLGNTINSSMSEFVACSGATTNDIYGWSEIEDPTGKWDEQPQINALGTETDIVTISIGGNNAKFAAFAQACIVSSCASDTTAYSDSINIIDGPLQSDLEEVYGTILSKVSSNTKVFVVGYPQVAPDIAEETLPLPYQCNYFESNTSGIYLDAVAAREIVTSLNETISDAVDQVRIDFGTTNLEFIDPNFSIDGSFDGHDVCKGTDSYFYNIQPNNLPPFDLPGLNNQAMIFHPNVAGQEEYYKIVKGYIESVM